MMAASQPASSSTPSAPSYAVPLYNGPGTPGLADQLRHDSLAMSQQHQHQHQQQPQQHLPSQHHHPQQHGDGPVDSPRDHHPQLHLQQAPPPQYHPLPQHPPQPSHAGMHYAAMNGGGAQHHHMPPPQHSHPSSLPPHGYAPLPPQYHPPPPPPYPGLHNGAIVMQMSPPMSGAAGMRYAIPQVPMHASHLGGGRHKKEIKRRTKTGCLTCRQRRIKCDEDQPACRNCVKSKRQCLGYDPVFKSQAAPVPAPLQPAPKANHIATAPPPHPSAHPGNHYQSPQLYQGPVESFIPSTAPAPNPPPPPPVEYAPPLDPALGGDPSPVMAQSNFVPALQAERRVNPMKIDDLFALHDIQPEYQKHENPSPPSAAVQSEIVNFIRFHYAPGLDAVFETNWYSTQALAHLHQDPQLQDFVGQCVELFKVRSDDGNATRALPSLEARLVWNLARLPRSAAERGTHDAQIQELMPRLATLENLLTGQFIDMQSVPPPPQQGLPPAIYETQMFWHQLGRFVQARDDRPDPQNDVNSALVPLRQMLGKVETRDVLYSIAVARHIGGRMPSFHPSRPLGHSPNNGPEDPVNQLKVAHKFVLSEDQQGTTQVIQRICGMALRSWALAKQ